MTSPTPLRLKMMFLAEKKNIFSSVNVCLSENGKTPINKAFIVHLKQPCVEKVTSNLAPFVFSYVRKENSLLAYVTRVEMWDTMASLQ